MKWGVFDHVDADGRAPGLVYRDRLALVEALDRLDAHAYFVAEHHGTPLGLAPSPGLLLSAMAARTRRIGLGALIHIAQLYHPMRLAEELCMLDHLSDGRLQLGLGRGAVFLEQELYGIDPATVPARYAEAREMVMQALTEGRVDREGAFHTIRDFDMVLRPAQRPLPPLWYGLGSVGSAEWAADNQVNCVSLMPAAASARLFDAYRARWQARGVAGPMPLLGVNRHVVVAESDARARAVADAAFPTWRASFEQLWKRRDVPLPMRFPETWAAMEAAGQAIAGSPATVRDYLAAQRDETGSTYVGCQILFGTMPLGAALASAELLAHEVMPGLDVAASEPALAAAG